MIKQITIIVDSTEDNPKIESYLKRFVAENFQKYKEAKISIDNLIPCPVCNVNDLIPCPVNAPVESYYCHFCNKSYKKEEIEKCDVPSAKKTQESPASVDSVPTA